MENLGGDPQGDHWEQMEQLLNDPANADLSENELDHSLRNKLTDVEPAFTGGHWEQMEYLLNDPSNADLSENELDHSLRNKLTDAEPAFAAAHWNLFEQQLDAEINTPEIEDVYLDGVTYELLNDLESPYDPEHWDIMQKRLEEEFSIRYKLVKYKVAELALLVLALFTAVSYFPADKLSAFQLPFVENVFPANTLEVVPAKTIDSKALNTNENSSPIAMANPSTSLTTSSDSDLTNNSDSNTASKQSKATGSITKPPQSKQQLQSAAPPEKHAKITLLETLETTTNQIVNSNKSVEPTIPALAESKTTEAESNSSMTDLLEEQLRVIPLINGLEISNLPQKSDDFIADFTKADVWKSPSFLRIGMFGASDLNYVLTPYNQEFDQAGYSSVTSGYGGGLSIGYKFGRWEIETGAMYATKSYRPNTVNVTFTAGNIGSGYEGLGWTGTQLDLLRIPIRARYDLVNMGKWYIYTQAGITGNLALNTIHSRKVYVYEPYNSSRSPTEPITIDFSTDETPPITENVGLLKKKQGSDEKNNFYTAEIGFGIEHFLSPRFSFFSQPTFHYQIGKNTIGLNKERINTLSLETGIRVSLKRNK